MRAETQSNSATDTQDHQENSLEERFEGTYSTDEFDRPQGRNYQYRIHLDDSAAMRRVRLADKIGGRFITTDHKDAPLGYVHVQTRDNKGHIPGLAEYAHSKSWEDFPAGPGRYQHLEMRNGSSGGTKISGEVYAGFDIYGCQIRYVDVTVTVSATPTEIKAAYESGENEDEVIGEIDDAIHWALEDRYDELAEELYEEYGDDLVY